MSGMKSSVCDPGHCFAFVSVLGAESAHTSGGLEHRGAGRGDIEPGEVGHRT